MAEYEEIMKKTRNHKLMCMLLTIMIMISGICFEQLQANSYFSCKQEAAIVKADSTIREVSAYESLQLKQREVIRSIQQVRAVGRRINSRSEYEAELCLFNVEALPQKFHSISAGEECSFSEHLCSVAILNYIHKQDGEKA